MKAHWFALVLLLRSTCVAVTPALAPSHPELQIQFLYVVWLLVFSFTLRIKPSRIAAANTLDVVGGVGVISTLLAAAFHTGASGAEYTSGLPEVKSALHWLKELADRYSLSGVALTRVSLQVMSRSIIARQHGTSMGSPKGQPLAGIGIWVDLSSMEATASALILEKLMRPHLVDRQLDVSVMLQGQEPEEGKSEQTVFMRSNGCFLQVDYLRGVLTSFELELPWTPVLQDEDFRFPSEAFCEEFRSLAPSFMPLLGRPVLNLEDLVQIILDCFKRIATVFEPQKYSSTMRLLRVKGAGIGPPPTGARQSFAESAADKA